MPSCNQLFLTVSTSIQLNLDAFDRTQPPLCGDDPDRNGFRRLCCRCPFAVRSEGSIHCEEFGIPIRAREKYALRSWKEVRDTILERDGHRCAVCGGEGDLHIHHVDCDPTNDDPGNLVTLCGICHARVHAGLHRAGGAERVARVMKAARRRPG